MDKPKMPKNRLIRDGVEVVVEDKYMDYLEKGGKAPMPRFLKNYIAGVAEAFADVGKLITGLFAPTLAKDIGYVTTMIFSGFVLLVAMISIIEFLTR